MAFIGAGQMARHHALAVQRLAVPAVIVGVHDRAAARAEELAALTGGRPYPSSSALLREARPDIV
ncbi:MAG TPA: Gfo/Idh/MocA family oxidoreductase, partial [Methylomirabilota bacterium]|nr:Gfo/Idh/MocA family oxidoreductase [Methylomirabilota bacterium]